MCPKFILFSLNSNVLYEYISLLLRPTISANACVECLSKLPSH